MAPPQYEVNRLSSDELTYELAIRGVTDQTTVEPMRQTLRNLLRLERRGTPIDYPDYPYEFAADGSALTTKIAELQRLLADFDGSDENKYKKLVSKGAFTLGRINRSKPTSTAEKAERSNHLVTVLNINSEVAKKLRSHRRAELSRDLSIVVSSGSSSTDESEEEFLSSTVQSSTTNPPRPKSVPVSQWNLKFTGESNSMSLSSFLERVEELKMARNVSEDELFRSGIDLFQGRAYIWYLSARKKAQDWQSLVVLLRKQFQPRDYNDKLFEEIKNRTMGPHESIGIYIAVMENLFSRLSVKLSEKARLRIIMNNITPFYQTQLALTNIDSIDELLDFCQRLEACKTSVEGYKAPPSRKTDRLLEPDLAYVDEYRANLSVSLADEVNTRNPRNVMKCYNCKVAGHKASECKEPHHRRCFKCGKPNFTVRTCPACNNKSISGNASARH